jgi:DNA-binding NtrC family response regulator
MVSSWHEQCSLAVAMNPRWQSSGEIPASLSRGMLCRIIGRRTAPPMSVVASILVVEPDHAGSERLRQILVDADHEVVCVGSAEVALEAIERRPFDVVISEIEMPGTDGMRFLEQVGRRVPELPVVLVAERGTIKLAVEAIKRGAADFVSKPLDRDELLHVVEKALKASERARDAIPDPGPSSGVLLGDSPSIAEVHATVRRAAPTLSTVLVRGESGTGKELVARALHEQSKRATAPFVKVNCAALPDTLLESELFGHEKGAFTGATSRKAGRVELAEGGTLFLDEIGDIMPALQAKLLRLLQQREYDRLGGTKTLRADVRFVAATNRELEKMVKRHEFREDLFFRLSVVPIWLPALRERPEDIERLAQRFCQDVAEANDRANLRIEKEALALLRTQRWRGNVRELQNFVERLVVLSDGPVISVADVKRELSRQPTFSTVTQLDKAGGGTLTERLRAAERIELVRALSQASNNRVLAARLLGISRRGLYTKLHEHGLL